MITAGAIKIIHPSPEKEPSDQGAQSRIDKIDIRQRSFIDFLTTKHGSSKNNFR